MDEDRRAIWDYDDEFLQPRSPEHYERLSMRGMCIRLDVAILRIPQAVAAMLWRLGERKN